MVKIHYGKHGWVRTNMKKSLQELFLKLNIDYTLPITQLQNENNFVYLTFGKGVIYRFDS